MFLETVGEVGHTFIWIRGIPRATNSTEGPLVEPDVDHPIIGVTVCQNEPPASGVLKVSSNPFPARW
jgi:hypothetical protein